MLSEELPANYDVDDKSDSEPNNMKTVNFDRAYNKYHGHMLFSRAPCRYKFNATKCLFAMG